MTRITLPRRRETPGGPLTAAAHPARTGFVAATPFFFLCCHHEIQGLNQELAYLLP